VPASEPGPAPTAVLVLPVGAQRYAVALAAAREVLAAPETTPLPGAPGALVGLCNVRGAILPLFDLALLHGRGGSCVPAFAVVVDAGAELAGFVTSARPWVGGGRATGRERGRLRIREGHRARPGQDRRGGRRRVSAALLDLAALLPLDPDVGDPSPGEVAGLAGDSPAAPLAGR